MNKTVSGIRKTFGYDPERGILLRKILANSHALPEINPQRQSVHYDGRHYSYAKLAWIVHYGRFPNGFVDHRDRNRHNHKITNLREATPAQNQQNKSGFGAYHKGVTWRNRKKKPWQAKIRADGKRIHLGSFVSQEEAASAYNLASQKYHGEFACAAHRQ